MTNSGLPAQEGGHLKVTCAFGLHSYENTITPLYWLDHMYIKPQEQRAPKLFLIGHQLVTGSTGAVTGGVAEERGHLT